MCVRIGELRESLSGYAAGLDAALLSVGQAELVLEQASRIEHTAAMLKSLAGARLAEAGSWRAEGDRSAAHHLARRTGTTVVQAAAAIDTARRLESLPETAAAARRGELSPEQAAAITDAAAADPAAEQGLLEAARRSPLAELREQCTRAKAAALEDPEARRRRIHARRSLRSYTDADGEWHLHCRNNPEVGARVMAALEPFREAIFRHARAEARREPPEAYAADALAEMARQSRGHPDGGFSAPATGRGAGSGETPGHTGDAEHDPPVTAVTAAGADMAATAVAASGADGVAAAVPADRADGAIAADSADGAIAAAGADAAMPGAVVGPVVAVARRAPTSRPKIIVRVDLGALLRGRPTEGEVCEIAGFGPVAVSAVRDMIDSEDPFLTAVATRGEKLVGVAHLGRRPNAWQQTALQWLYPSCANESCTARARLDYEHRADWASTHLTVLDLLDRLCQHCHALKTRQSWSLVEGRGKRPLVPPDDPRHPRNAVGHEQPPKAIEPRAKSPPGC